MVWAYIAVLVASVIAVILDSKVDITVKIGADFVVFAVLYVVAQATERFVEPLIGKVSADEADIKDKKAAAKQATQKMQAAVNAGNPTDAETAAKGASTAQENLAALQRRRAVIGWSMASCFALVVCGILGLGVIESIADVSGDPDDLNLFRRVDVVLTGLAVGAGTKPLHDLISRLEKAKTNADPAT